MIEIDFFDFWEKIRVGPVKIRFFQNEKNEGKKFFDPLTKKMSKIFKSRNFQNLEIFRFPWSGEKMSKNHFFENVNFGPLCEAISPVMKNAIGLIRQRMKNIDQELNIACLHFILANCILEL